MSMLKSAVFVAFLLLALVSESHAACYHEKLKPGATECQDFSDKTFHPMGSTWRNQKCERCSCQPDFKSCCDGLPAHAFGGCTIKYDYETCTYEVISVDKSVGCRLTG